MKFQARRPDRDTADIQESSERRGQRENEPEVTGRFLLTRKALPRITPARARKANTARR